MATESSAKWQGEVDQWQGYTRHRFSFEGRSAWVVEPKKARAGTPWAWCMEFPDAFTARCAGPQLLAEGFHFVHIDMFNNFGAPSAVKVFTAYHDYLVKQGLSQKVVLIGVSRGGLSSYRFASENPDKVAVVYGDAPVCDFKSWPGGKGKGTGSPSDWEACQGIYGFASEAEALAYPGNPIDILPRLFQAKVAIIHVVGDVDAVVPVAENTAIVEERYRKLGGKVMVIHKPGVDHHPHGLEDPKPVVDFILANI